MQKFQQFFPQLSNMTNGFVSAKRTFAEAAAVQQPKTEAPSSGTKELKLTFASPTKAFYANTVVKQIDVPGMATNMRILPIHVPAIAVLKPGILIVCEVEAIQAKLACRNEEHRTETSLERFNSMSGLTTTFSGQLNTDLRKLDVKMVPFPRVCTSSCPDLARFQPKRLHPELFNSRIASDLSSIFPRSTTKSERQLHWKFNADPLGTLLDGKMAQKLPCWNIGAFCGQLPDSPKMADEWPLGTNADWQLPLLITASNGSGNWEGEALLDIPWCAIRPRLEADSAEQQTLAIVWWTNAVCLPAIAALGLFCNGLNLLVLGGNEQARRMPSWHLLVALALFDSLFLLCAVLELAVPASLDGRPALVSAHTRMVLYIRMMASSFYKASILIVVAFNVERYLCVCRPLWAHRTGILQRRTGTGGGRGTICVALGIGVACSLQWPLAWHVLECQELEKGPNGTQISHHSIVLMRESPALQANFSFIFNFFKFYYRLMDWFCLLAFNLLPILLLSILNFQLVLTLRRIVRRDSSASSTFVQPEDVAQLQQLNHPTGQISILESSDQSGTSGLNANAMLFAVVLLLFICIGPQVPARLLYEWHGHYQVDAILYTCISQQLVFLNASLNFCLYCLVSRRYRALLKRSARNWFPRTKFGRNNRMADQQHSTSAGQENRGGAAAVEQFESLH